MASKADYLKKYLSGGAENKKKKRRKVKKESNIAIHDDDVNWKSLVPEEQADVYEDDDPEDAPAIAEFVDDPTLRKARWKAVWSQDDAPTKETEKSNNQQKRLDSDLNPPRKYQKTSPDISPPRKANKRRDSPNISPRRSNKRHDSPDMSPPRKSNRRHDSPDMSPPGRSNKRHDSPDMSPPRRLNKKHDSPDISPPRRSNKRYESHSSPDMSPPRRSNTKRDSPDISPPRRPSKRHGLDISPPRKLSKRHDSPDISPPRRSNNRHDSPEIQQKKQNTDLRSSPGKYRKISPDTSPPRKSNKRHDSPDISPPRNPSKRHDSPDVSPPRKATKCSGKHSTSPPRKGFRSPDSLPRRKTRWDSHHHSSRPSMVDQPRHHDSMRSPPHKLHPSLESDRKASSGMLSGAKGGIQSAEALKQELDADKMRKDQYFRDMDPEVSGRLAQTVYRKEGRVIDLEAEKAKKEEEDRQKAIEDAEFARWGRGVAQVKSAQEKLADELHEMAKPLARYRDDEDLERMLKEREREGDPMLKFIKKKKDVTIDKAGNKRPRKERPTYKGSFQPNRFGIRPGYRWDGLDRSNGFEKAWYKKQSQKTAIQEVAYKWSTEDM